MRVFEDFLGPTLQSSSSGVSSSPLSARRPSGIRSTRFLHNVAGIGLQEWRQPRCHKQGLGLRFAKEARHASIDAKKSMQVEVLIVDRPLDHPARAIEITAPGIEIDQVDWIQQTRVILAPFHALQPFVQFPPGGSL